MSPAAVFILLLFGLILFLWIGELVWAEVERRRILMRRNRNKRGRLR